MTVYLVYIYACARSAQGRQKRVSWPLELELPKAVNFHVVLRREPRSSARATTALKHRGVSPDSSAHHRGRNNMNKSSFIFILQLKTWFKWLCIRSTLLLPRAPSYLHSPVSRKDVGKVLGGKACTALSTVPSTSHKCRPKTAWRQDLNWLRPYSRAHDWWLRQLGNPYLGHPTQISKAYLPQAWVWLHSLSLGTILTPVYNPWVQLAVEIYRINS